MRGARSPVNEYVPPSQYVGYFHGLNSSFDTRHFDDLRRTPVRVLS